MTEFDFDSPPIVLTVCGRTDRGQARAENQDHFLVADLSAPLRDDSFMINPHNLRDDGSVRFNLGQKGALLVVADGLGGAAAGAVASEMAAAWIYQTLITHWGADRRHTPEQFASRLRGAVEHANERIHDHAHRHPECQGMGTTATTVGVLENYVYVAQVGDSRAYLVRSGAAIQLTRDQSLVQHLVDAGAMSAEDAERGTHAHGNMILQALGTEPHVEVELTYQETRRGDVLLLCSDGLFRVVDKAELAEIAAMPDAAGACEALVRMANERGGPDNVTVVIAHLGGEGLAEPAGEAAVGRRVFELPR